MANPNGEMIFTYGDVYGNPALVETSEMTVPDADDQASVNENYDEATKASVRTASSKKILLGIGTICAFVIIFGGAK